MASAVDVPAGIEAQLGKIVDVLQKQTTDLADLRNECAALRSSNSTLERLLRESLAARGDASANPGLLPPSLSPVPSRENVNPFLGRPLTPQPLPVALPTRHTRAASKSKQLIHEIPGFYVVIPAGGAGTRLWPLSRESHPKFLLDVNLSGRSLLQSTWNRLVPLAGPNRMTIVAGPAHSVGIQSQLPRLQQSNLFTEPGPKDSMAAIGLAAAVLLHRDPDAIIGSFAADHMISGEEAFMSAVTEAVEVAKAGFLTTIGIAPSHPATGFGYVRLGDELDIETAPSARLVSSFKEKPDARTAATYLASGEYRWNAGMFVTKASVLMDLVQEYAPSIYDGLMKIAKVWDDEEARNIALQEVWPTLDKVAIDNAIAEPAALEEKVAVIPATFGWDDVGDFSSLAEMLPAEPNFPRVLGDQKLVLAEQAAGGIVVPASGRLIACLGVDDLIIVDMPDALMVTTRARSQEVKTLVKKCRDAGWKALL